MPYERDHADLQCLILNDKAFVLKHCKRLSKALNNDYQVVPCGERFSGQYPDNVCLSAILCGDKLICREPSIDIAINEYCQQQGYELLHVKQGYVKCSCAQISDSVLITADQGIINTLKNTDIEVLEIGKGHIQLDNADHGFIGGASGFDNKRNTLFFCGNLQHHPDEDRIRDFCSKYNTEIINLSDDNLTDIGGIIFC